MKGPICHKLSIKFHFFPPMRASSVVPKFALYCCFSSSQTAMWDSWFLMILPQVSSSFAKRLLTPSSIYIILLLSSCAGVWIQFPKAALQSARYSNQVRVHSMNDLPSQSQNVILLNLSAYV